MESDTLDTIIAIATVGTALGTLLLAAATFRLASQTRELAGSSNATASATLREVELVSEQVEAAKQQADAARAQTETAQAALGASIRPLLVEVRPGTFEERVARRYHTPSAERRDTRKVDISEVFTHMDAETEALVLEAPIRNVGTGPAMIRGVQLLFVLAGDSKQGVVGDAEYRSFPQERSADSDSRNRTGRHITPRSRKHC